MEKKKGLFERPSPGIGASHQNLAFTGQGIAPDLMSEQGLATFPEANRTTLEEGVYGQDGMMPPPGITKKISAESGSGGAGSFLNSPNAPKERV